MMRTESGTRTNPVIQDAIDALQAGDPILVHDFDDREGETDLLIPAAATTPSDVSLLRNEAGGLVFVAIPDAVAEEHDLPFLHDELDHPSTEYDDVGYDSRPSFSLSVNHRDTYTGITDADRALTIGKLAEAVEDPVGTDFGAKFRAPGHVHVLRAAPNLLVEREGHTELALAMAELADITPAVVGAEILDDKSGEAMTKGKARQLSRASGIPYVDGQAITREFRRL